MSAKQARAMTGSHVKRLVLKILNACPDDATDAITVLAMAFSMATVGSGCPDDAAIDAIKIGLEKAHAEDARQRAMVQS